MTPQELPRSRLALLTALAALGPLSTDLYLPSLPALGRSFQAGVADVQLTLSLFLGAFAFSQLACGALSDRFGRRPILLAGLALFCAASVGCALAPSLPALVALRVLQAIGACTGPVLSRAVVRDTQAGARSAKTLAVIALAMALAPALGPLVGGLLVGHLGWRASFWALALFGALTLASCAVLLPETRPAARRTSARLRDLLGSRAYVGYVLLAGCAYGGIFAYVSGSAHVLVGTLGLSPQAYGASFVFTVGGYMSGNLCAQRLVARVGIARLVAWGSGTSLVGALVMCACAAAGVEHVAAVVGPFCVFMLGAGLTLPSAYAGALAPWPESAGSASAWLGFVQMLLAACASALVGGLADGTALPLALAVLGCALGGAASVALARAVESGTIADQPASPVRSA